MEVDWHMVKSSFDLSKLCQQLHVNANHPLRIGQGGNIIQIENGREISCEMDSSYSIWHNIEYVVWCLRYAPLTKKGISLRMELVDIIFSKKENIWFKAKLHQIIIICVNRKRFATSIPILDEKNIVDHTISSNDNFSSSPNQYIDLSDQSLSNPSINDKTLNDHTQSIINQHMLMNPMTRLLPINMHYPMHPIYNPMYHPVHPLMHPMYQMMEPSHMLMYPIIEPFIQSMMHSIMVNQSLIQSMYPINQSMWSASENISMSEQNMHLTSDDINKYSDFSE